MRVFYRLLALGAIISLLLGANGSPESAVKAATWQQKVDFLVLSAAAQGETEFLVFLSEQPDLSAAAALVDKTARGAYVFETLTSFAEVHQKPVRDFFDVLGITYQSFWIVNMLWVRGDFNLVQQIAQRADVDRIHANPKFRLRLPENDLAAEIFTADAVEWNIEKINADDVWAEGYTGQGVVVGGQDTGYEWNHPALKNQYRGWNGITVSHDYNWYDATGLSPDEPVDPHSHGTHTMGTMVGDDGGANQIGVAPGAKWIGCRNMNSFGFGTPATYTACYQWFVAPTRTDGSDPRPDLAPDVISNSWSCPESEGCTELDILLPAVQAVRAAGIFTAHSAGNSGPYCETVNQPAAIYAESFTVGSTTSTDDISTFSSRGPVTVDGSNRFKPQVTAPGSYIRSAIPGGSYGIKSGTSMAAPHVAGLAALLISAQPALDGQVDDLENLIEQSALPLYTTADCGGDTPTSHPNYTFGWGRIDAWDAYQNIPHGLLVGKTAPQVILPGDILTYTLKITNGHPFLEDRNVVLTDTIPDKTEFFAATGNYSINEDTITWDFGDLTAKEAANVQLGLVVSTTATGTITNSLYAATSDETATPAKGNAVSTLIQEPGVEISPGQSGIIHDPCNPAILKIYGHEITNTGNFTDTFDLSVMSSLAWANTTIAPFTLASGETVIADIEIDPPCPTPSGTTDITAITVSSLTDPSATQTVTDTTTIAYRFFLQFIFHNP